MFIKTIKNDVFRYSGTDSLLSILKQMFFGESFKFIFWLRVRQYLKCKVWLKPLYFLSGFIFRHYKYKFGIDISDSMELKSGIFIGHFGSIIINKNSLIGHNCNISQNVTIGQANRGKRVGTPKIGNSVYLGPGAVLIGNICIGNNVAIGANCVVTKDIPENAVVVGVPGKIISYDGSYSYIQNSIRVNDEQQN